jgi:hypothetical protein
LFGGEKMSGDLNKQTAAMQTFSYDPSCVVAREKKMTTPGNRRQPLQALKHGNNNNNNSLRGATTIGVAHKNHRNGVTTVSFRFRVS